MNPDIVTTVLTAVVLAVVCRTVWDVLDQSPPPDSEGSRVSRVGAAAHPAAANSDLDLAGRPGRRLSEKHACLPSEIARQVAALRAIDDRFDADQFLSDSRIIYETIVAAFASGDRPVLRDLLADWIYEVFAGEISLREELGQRAVSSFVCFKKSEIVGVRIAGERAEISVDFVSELVTATLDSTDSIVSGNPAKVVAMHDRWTFARELKSRSPGWKLVETE